MGKFLHSKKCMTAAKGLPVNADRLFALGKRFDLLTSRLFRAIIFDILWAVAMKGA